jgi:hypothetical protein
VYHGKLRFIPLGIVKQLVLMDAKPCVA